MISRITDQLYLCEVSDILGLSDEETKVRLEQLETLKINHIISLCVEGLESKLIRKEAKVFKSNLKSKIQFHHIPVPASIKIANGHDPYKTAFQIVYKEINGILFNDPESRILVHCVAAIDRSPFAIASYLAKSCRINIADAYLQIKKTRSHVVEHYEWVWWQPSPDSLQVPKEQVS